MILIYIIYKLARLRLKERDIEMDIGDVRLNIINLLNKLHFLSESADRINDNCSLKNFGLNSLNVIRLTVALENEFGIIVDDDQLVFENFDSIKKIYEFVLHKLEVRKDVIK